MKHLVSLVSLFALVHSVNTAFAQGTEAAPSTEEANSDAAPSKVGVTPPRPLTTVTPVYPAQQLASGTGAVVVLQLTLDTDGTIVEASVAESGGPDFDREALAIVPQLRFAPAAKDGVPMAAKIPFRVEFAPQAVPAAGATAALPAPTGASASAPVTPASAPTAPAMQTKAVRVEPTPSDASAAGNEEALDVDVEGKRPEREATRHELSGREITRIPGTNGDALRSLVNMPGVARPPDGRGMLLVRGSAPDDSRIYTEGIEIPMAYHFDGLSSVLPSELLERIDFYPGNFGPEYGRATGGVVALEIRSPRADRLGGLLQVDVLDARALVEGPINDSTRVLVGARRSWVDAWLGPLFRSGGLGVGVAPFYYDGQLLIEHDLSNRTRVRLFTYGAEDQLRLFNPAPSAGDPSDGGPLSLKTGFWRSQLSLDTRPTDKITWVNTLSAGQDREQFSQGNIDAITKAWKFGARSDLRAQLSDKVKAVGGIDVDWSHYDAHWRFPTLNFETGESDGPLFGRPTVDIAAKAHVGRPAAYAMVEYLPIPELKLMPGVRANYDTDTRHVTVEPRLSARYDAVTGPRRTTLKGGVGLFYQPPDPYESVAPFGTPGVQSPHAMHYSLGVEQELSRPVELSVEGFYKKIDDLVVPVAAADSEDSGSSYQNIGSGQVYGGELLLRYKPVDRFFGWIAYTLSRSERRDGPNEPVHLFEYDQTHILTALGSYKLGRGWEVGSRFRYVTGSPYTPNLGGVMDFDAGAYSPIESSKVNSVRGEAYHQLDVRIDKTWRFKSWQLGAYLDVQNVYNHRSSDQPIYNYNFSKTSRVPGTPILPVLGLRGEL